MSLDSGPCVKHLARGERCLVLVVAMVLAVFSQMRPINVPPLDYVSKAGDGSRDFFIVQVLVPPHPH